MIENANWVVVVETQIQAGVSMVEAKAWYVRIEPVKVHRLTRNKLKVPETWRKKIN